MCCSHSHRHDTLAQSENFHDGKSKSLSIWRKSENVSEKCECWLYFFGNFISIFDLCCEISAGTFVAPLTQLLTATQHNRNENVTIFECTIIKTF